MARKLYTEEQIAHYLAVLRSNGQNLKQTSKQTGVTRATLRAWAAGKLPAQMDPNRIAAGTDKITEALAEQFGKIAVKSLASAEGKIPAASYRDLLIGAGIATEKRELLRGGPTKRQETNIRVSLTGGLGLRELSSQVIEGQYRALPEPHSDQSPQRQAQPE